MNRLQLIVNDKMRLEGADQCTPGEYVIANEWKVLQKIGPRIDCITLTCKVKAMAIDYETKEIATVYNIESSEFKAINDATLKPYNPRFGYFWGVDLLIWSEENGEYYSWFLCTANTRPLAKQISFRSRYLIGSKKIDVGKSGYWTPTLRILVERVDATVHYPTMRQFNG